jgi:hypothetical protein
VADETLPAWAKQSGPAPKGRPDVVRDEGDATDLEA